MASREHSLTNPVWKGREEELLPLCSGAESDSANLDHVAELLMRTGVPAEESLMILVPEAYDNHPDLQKHYPEVCLLPTATCNGALLFSRLGFTLHVHSFHMGAPAETICPCVESWIL